MSTTTGAGDAGASRTLHIAGRDITIERPTGLKASRALALLRDLSRAAPGLQSELADFRRTYERDNVVELDPVQARVQYPPRAVMDGDKLALDEHGQPRMLPSPIDRITEAEWERAGGVLKMPATPAPWEVAVALLDHALEAAEDTVYRFVALFTIPNGELKQARKAGTDDELIRDRAVDLLDDAYADDLLELAVVVSETVDHHFRRKASFLGDRLGKLMGQIMPGLDWTTTSTSTPTDSTSATTPESAKPSSSIDSQPNTPDGPPMSSSTPPMTSSSTSESSPEPTPNGNGAPRSEPTPAATATE